MIRGFVSNFGNRDLTGLLRQPSQTTAIGILSPVEITVQSFRFLKKSIKDNLDYSKVPSVKEEEIEESFIHGSGPGGQAVNKGHNCVQLKHLPSGVVIKCHEYREAEKNRILARQRLVEKLDELINREDSVSNQIKRLEAKRRTVNETKKARLRELKRGFKEREGID